MGKGKLHGRTESAKGNTIRPMKLRLGITIDIESELAYGCSCTGGPRWIASTVSESGHSVDAWHAERDVVDMTSAGTSFDCRWRSGCRAHAEAFLMGSAHG